MVSQPSRKLFVEGGGDDNEALRTECRRAFRKLLEGAGLVGRMPRIVACGDRAASYTQFCNAIRGGAPGDIAILLVDAEAPVVEDSAWEHVRNREGDRWVKPPKAVEEQLHLMVQCMESWFLADRVALKRFYGQGYQESALPSEHASIESIAKVDLYGRLEQATRGTKTKGAYGKSAHSFKVLATLDPARIRSSSPWAERFFATLDSLLR